MQENPEDFAKKREFQIKKTAETVLLQSGSAAFVDYYIFMEESKSLRNPCHRSGRDGNVVLFSSFARPHSLTSAVSCNPGAGFYCDIIAIITNKASNDRAVLRRSARREGDFSDRYKVIPQSRALI